MLSGLAVVCRLAGIQPFPFDIAWVAIVLCGVPIILEAIIGLVTAFDIKADVLVSLALIASAMPPSTASWSGKAMRWNAWPR